MNEEDRTMYDDGGLRRLPSLNDKKRRYDRNAVCKLLDGRDLDRKVRVEGIVLSFVSRMMRWAQSEVALRGLRMQTGWPDELRDQQVAAAVQELSRRLDRYSSILHLENSLEQVCRDAVNWWLNEIFPPVRVPHGTAKRGNVELPIGESFTDLEEQQPTPGRRSPAEEQQSRGRRSKDLEDQRRRRKSERYDAAVANLVAITKQVAAERGLSPAVELIRDDPTASLWDVYKLIAKLCHARDPRTGRRELLLIGWRIRELADRYDLDAFDHYWDNDADVLAERQRKYFNGSDPRSICASRNWPAKKDLRRAG